MPDDDGLVDLERVEQAGGEVGERGDVVLVLGARALAEAGQIGHVRRVLVDEQLGRRHHVAAGDREAVQVHDRDPCGLLTPGADEHGRASDDDPPVLEHRLSSSLMPRTAVDRQPARRHDAHHGGRRGSAPHFGRLGAPVARAPAAVAGCGGRPAHQEEPPCPTHRPATRPRT